MDELTPKELYEVVTDIAESKGLGAVDRTNDAFAVVSLAHPSRTDECANISYKLSDLEGLTVESARQRARYIAELFYG